MEIWKWRSTNLTETVTTMMKILYPKLCIIVMFQCFRTMEELVISSFFELSLKYNDVSVMIKDFTVIFKFLHFFHARNGFAAQENP